MGQEFVSLIQAIQVEEYAEGIVPVKNASATKNVMLGYIAVTLVASTPSKSEKGVSSMKNVGTLGFVGLVENGVARVRDPFTVYADNTWG